MARRFDRWRRHGDLRALGAVFDELGPRLLSVALHLCGNPADAEDALQDAFVLAMRRADSFDCSRRLEPWLAGLLTNTARNGSRRERRRRALELPELCSSDEGPIAAAERRELVDALRTHVDELPAEQRQVLRLQLQHGLAPAQIAEVLEVPPGTVRMRLFRGLAALRRLMPAGLAAWLSGVLPARGLGSVRLVVMQVGKEHAVAASAAAATVGGVLVMKKVFVGLAAVLVFGAFWWWASSMPMSLSTVAPPAGQTVAASAADARVPVVPPTEDVGAAGAERIEAAETPGSLCVRVHAVVGGADGEPPRVLPLAGTWLQAWSGSRDQEPFAERARSIATDGAGEAVLTGLGEGSWHLGLLDEATPPEEVDVRRGAEVVVELRLAARSVAHGIVVDVGGAPVAGAELWVHRGTYLDRYGKAERTELTCRQVGVSDAQGRFAVPIAAHESRIGACHPEHGESFGRSLTDRDELRLVLGPGGASLSGTVRDHAGALVAGAFVHLVPAGRDSRRAADGTLLQARVDRTTRTDAAGRFAFAGVAPGSLEVQASVFAASAREKLELAPSEHRAVDLQLTDNVVVTGTVRYADGSPAREHVFSTPNEDLNGHYCECNVREDGTYFLYYQPRRRFFVVVGRHGHATAVREFAHPEGSVIRCDFVLDRILPLDGRVLAANGAPLSGWKVIATDDAKRSKAAVTGDDGAFRMAVSVDATFALVAFPPDGDRARPAATRTGVRAGGRPIVLPVPAASMPTASVRGRLVDPAQWGLADRQLVLHRSGDQWSRVASPTTDGNGRFRIDGLSAGDLALAPLVRDEIGAPLATFSLTDGQDLDLGEIVIQPSAALDVHITRADGSPWRGAMPSVIVRDPVGKSVLIEDYRKTDDGARITVPGGDYRVEVAGTDLIGEQREVSLQPATSMSLHFAVAIGRSRDLVFNGDGRHKPGGVPLHLRVCAADGSVVLERVTDRRDYAWNLRGFDYWSVDHTFPLGRYTVEASTDGGLRYRGNFEVTDDVEASTRVDVPLADK